MNYIGDDPFPMLMVLEQLRNPVVLNMISNLSFLDIRIGIVTLVSMLMEGRMELTTAVCMKYAGKIERGTGVTAQVKDLS